MVGLSPNCPLKPSEYLARQLHATFQDDPVGIANIDITGATPLAVGGL